MKTCSRRTRIAHTFLRRQGLFPPELGFGTGDIGIGIGIAFGTELPAVPAVFFGSSGIGIRYFEKYRI